MKIKQNILLQAINIHRHLVKEIKIEFSENGIRIFSVDPSNCELVITTIPKTACEEYNVERDLEMGIDMQKIKEYLRLFKKDDVLTFDYDADVNRLLGKEGNLTRGMGLLDLAGWPDPKIPKVDLKNKVSINTKIFYDSLKGIMSNKNYEHTYISTTRDSLILENQDDDEDHDKENRSVIMQDTGALTVDYCNATDNNYTIFRSDFLIKQINEYKKCFDHVIIETSPREPIRITANNDNLQVEYWLAPLIRDDDHERQVILEDQEEPDTEKELKPETEIEKTVEPEIIEPLEAIKEIVKPTEFDKIEPVDATVNGVEYATDEINDPEAYTDIDERQEEYIETHKDKLEPKSKSKSKEEIEPVIDVHSDRLSIRKPKGLEYEKHQWTIDMEKIRDKLEKSLKKESKKALSKVTEIKGFVFFVVNSTDVKADNGTGENIIENLLGTGFVLIAWYRYKPEKWIAQTVKKVE